MSLGKKVLDGKCTHSIVGVDSCVLNRVCLSIQLIRGSHVQSVQTAMYTSYYSISALSWPNYETVHRFPSENVKVVHVRIHKGC